MTRGKLISDLRNFDSSHLDLDEEIVVFFFGDHNGINFTSLGVSKRLRAVLEHLLDDYPLAVVVLLVLGLNDLTDDDVISCNMATWSNQTVFVEF